MDGAGLIARIRLLAEDLSLEKATRGKNPMVESVMTAETLGREDDFLQSLAAAIEEDGPAGADKLAKRIW